MLSNRLMQKVDIGQVMAKYDDAKQLVAVCVVLIVSS